MRKEPVLIESGNQIFINVVTNTLWISRETAPEQGSNPSIPEQKGGQRHCPVKRLLKSKVDGNLNSVALSLAGVVAWVAGFYVEDITEHYLPSKDVFVFRVI